MTAEGLRRAQRLKQATVSVDYGLQVARFCFFYPGMPYLSPSWPTSDGIIPWMLFQMMYTRLFSVLALARLNAGQAAQTGVALTVGQIPHADLDEAFTDAER